jgi:CIC family chloride channel protein
MMSGVSKTPIAASILMAEVVGGYAVLIPVMLASVVAYMVTGDQTLFRNQVARRPFVYDPATLDEVTVEKVMRGDPVTLNSGMTAAEARKATVEEPHYLYPVVDPEGRVLGVVLREQLEDHDGPGDLVETMMIRHFEKVRAGTSAYQAFEDMNQKQISRMLVVGHDDGILLGTLTRIDLMEYLEHKDEEHRLY